MRLEGLTEFLRSNRFPTADERRRPSRDDIQALRKFVSEAMADTEFALDCLERDVDTYDSRLRTGGLSPFYSDPEHGVDVALAHWGPGDNAGPHEHTDWTITAVFHNCLEVKTFDYEAARAERRLQLKNCFFAQQGKVGYIYDPCIHDPHNPTEDWSTSFHIIRCADRPMLHREVGPIEGLIDPDAEMPPPSNALIEAIGRRHLDDGRRAQLAALARFHTPRAMDLTRALTERLPSDKVGVGTRLVRSWQGVTFSVMESAEEVELVASAADSVLVLLSMQAWAAPALEAVATATAFEVGDLPGLAVENQVALCRQLIREGMFRPAE